MTDERSGPKKSAGAEDGPQSPGQPEQPDRDPSLPSNPTPPTSSPAPPPSDTLSYADSTLPADEPGPTWLPERTGPQSIAGLDDSEHVSMDQPSRYQIKSERGRGAIGRVMIAFDDHIGREVALKELLTMTGPGGSDPGSPSQSPMRVTAQATARFLREARITGQLEHPSIVPVYEIARRHDGSLYYTMRLVKGETMAERLKQCPTIQDRLRLLPNFLSLCQAMAYAHSRGVIHRDLKPANIIIGEFGETVVLDWGLAKVRGIEDVRADDLQEDLRLIKEAGADQTVSGQPIGTPSYMSPEQAEGRIEQIDEASDVWSLGAILHELLTGRPPFIGRSAWEVMARVATDPLEPITRLEPGAPAELVAIAEKCLTKDKPMRYADAGALAEDIARFQSGGMVSAYEYHLPALLRRFLARQWPWVALAASLLVIVVIGAGGWFMVSQEKQRSRYNELLYVFTDTTNLAGQGETDHASKVLDNFVQKYPDYSMAYFARGYFYYNQKRYDDSIKDYDRAIELDPEYMDAYVNRALGYAEKGQLDRALADYDHVIEREPEWALAYINRATAYYKKKDYDRAIKDGDRAIELEPDNALAYANRGGAYNDLGQYDRAVSDYNRALQLEPANLYALLSRGAAYYHLRKLDLAVADYDKVIKLYPDNALAYFNRAEVHYLKTEYDLALADYNRSLELDPEQADPSMGRGNAYTALGQPDQAIADFDRALELNPQYSLAFYNRGNVYYSLADYDRARADYDRAIELDPANAAAYISRGALLYVQNDLDAALADFNRALELDPKNALAFLNRANVHARRQENDQARADYDRALELDPDNFTARYNRCDFLYKAGELDAAKADCQRLVELAPDDANSRVMLANIFFVQGDLARARDEYTRAMELGPDDPVAAFNRGNVNYRLGDLAAAVADYTRAIELQPDHALAWSNRGEVNYRLGNPEDALRDYSRALELDPQNFTAWFNRATLHYERREMAESVADFESASKQNPSDPGPLAGAAWILATSADDNIRDPARALELVLQACQLTNYQDPVHFDTLAAAYAADGQFDLAVSWQEKAIAGLTPENDAAYRGDFQKRLHLYRQRRPYRE